MKQQYDIIALIPARGGSKRLLRKNMLPFCGLPLVEWTVIQAICSHNIKKPTDVYLSTDDDEIASIGEKHGISIIRRPDWPNPDELSAAFVNIHAINKIRETRDYDIHLDTMVTCPMRFPNDMDRAVNRYIEVVKEHPNCGEVNWFIPQQEIHLRKKLDDNLAMTYMWNKDGWFGMMGTWAIASTPDYYIEHFSRNTDADYEQSNFWMEPGKTGRPFHYVVGAWFQVFDIDNRDDFDLCEFLMERYVLKGRGAQLYYDYKKRQKE